MSEALFHNKKKNLFVGVMAAAGLLVSLLSSNFVLYDMTVASSWRYNLNTLFFWLMGNSVGICVLTYLLTKKKEFGLKKWILPIGFGISCLYSLIGFPYSVRVVSEYATVYTVTIFALTCLSAIAVLLCFVGTLFDFEFVKLFRAGILLRAVVPVVLTIIETVLNITNGYFAAYGLAGLSFTALAELLILTLIDVGLFLLTVNKEEK